MHVIKLSAGKIIAIPIYHQPMKGEHWVLSLKIFLIKKIFQFLSYIYLIINEVAYFSYVSLFYVW